MKIKLVFEAKSPIFLQTGYLHSIQGLIYNMLDRLSADWLHTEGFQHKNRFFKLFVFSEINERGKFVKNKGFYFPERISFYLASPIHWIIEQIAKNGIMAESYKLGCNDVKLVEISTYPQEKIENEKVIIKTLSPIEVHSTLKKPDGSSKTYYYNPREQEFSTLIEKNIKKKWEILHKKECKLSLKISPLYGRNLKEKTIIVKDSVIKGWKGRFILEGDNELIQLAFETGLGSHNSLGFGMIEPVKQRRKEGNYASRIS